MKTIRYNCFETNSSSTHAISVKKDINEIDHESIKSVIINNKKLVIVDVDDLDENPHNDALTKLKYFARWIIMKQNSMLYCYLKYKNKQEIEPDDEFGDIISFSQLRDIIIKELNVDDVLITTKYFNHTNYPNDEKHKFMDYKYLINYVYIWTSFYLIYRLGRKLKDTKPKDVKEFIFNKKYYIGIVDYGMELKV